MNNRIRDAILGVAVGDAIGVPVEFLSRKQLKDNPVTGMMGYGTHNQPPGTWSDDSSLTLCLADSLCDGYDTEDIGKKFVYWKERNFWTPHGEMFGIGLSTSAAINKISSGAPAHTAGGTDMGSNGNGSLMRILPIAFILSKETDMDKKFHTISEVSSITHGHFISLFSCLIYVEIAINLINGQSKNDSYMNARISINKFVKKRKFDYYEVELFDRILKTDISSIDEEEIYSSGYVLHTIEASIWSFLRCNSYKEGVLTAVNLGGDTDTTGAVAGGLLGLCYGINGIPENWVENISRYDDVVDLCDKLNESL